MMKYSLLATVDGLYYSLTVIPRDLIIPGL